MFNSIHATAESVTDGHPDKICDQISDAILDAYLVEDPESRVAIEVFGAHGLLVIGGEVTSRGSVDHAAVARAVYESIGYNEPLTITTRVVKQSPDIARGVDIGGAGDQGIMYGYATNETPEYLPREAVLAHALAAGLQALRKQQIIPWLQPDGKTQVSRADGRIMSVLVSCQHDASISLSEITEVIKKRLIEPVAPKADEVLINPTGRFVRGGFAADTGLTGRKIMVDTYGGRFPHGGGAFSGKDPTKVDRSAAYMARFAAKNLVANGYGERCLVSVAYAIGRTEPLMLAAVNERGVDLGSVVRKHFDFRPQAMIERLNLRRPIYRNTAVFGHFGKEGLPWETIEPFL